MDRYDSTAASTHVQVAMCEPDPFQPRICPVGLSLADVAHLLADLGVSEAQCPIAWYHAGDTLLTDSALVRSARTARAPLLSLCVARHGRPAYTRWALKGFAAVWQEAALLRIGASSGEAVTESIWMASNLAGIEIKVHEAKPSRLVSATARFANAGNSIHGHFTTLSYCSPAKRTFARDTRWHRNAFADHPCAKAACPTKKATEDCGRVSTQKVDPLSLPYACDVWADWTLGASRSLIDMGAQLSPCDRPCQAQCGQSALCHAFSANSPAAVFLCSTASRSVHAAGAKFPDGSSTGLHPVHSSAFHQLDLFVPSPGMQAAAAAQRRMSAEIGCWRMPRQALAIRAPRATDITSGTGSTAQPPQAAETHASADTDPEDNELSTAIVPFAQGLRPRSPQRKLFGTASAHADSCSTSKCSADWLCHDSCGPGSRSPSWRSAVDLRAA